MAPPSDKGASAAVQPAYVIPDCGCGDKECVGPEPVPWLSWKHCFKFYEFRYATVPLAGPAATNIGRLVVRVRYEHAFCLMGRKQGPIVHSLTLLPKEVVRIYEYDRYRRATSATSRFSVRTSFFTLTQRVQDTYSSTKTEAGTSFSTSSSASASGGGGIDLGIVSFGGGSSVSGSVNASAHFDVATVSERFSHIAETSSLAVETERSIVVSTFEESESGQSTARTLRNDNECRAVTYFIRRVFEVYQLSTRIVSIEVQLGDTWIDITAAPAAIQEEVKRFLGKINVGGRADPKVEIALPTDGLLYEAELAHCCSCDCEHEARSHLELEKLQLENLALRLEAARRQKRLDAGELDPFEPPPIIVEEDDDD
jgi:thermitase